MNNKKKDIYLKIKSRRKSEYKNNEALNKKKESEKNSNLEVGSPKIKENKKEENQSINENTDFLKNHSNEVNNQFKLTNLNLESNSESCDSNSYQFKKSIKKESHETLDRTLHPRLLLVTNRVDLNKEYEIKTDKNELNKNEIICGLCKEITTNKDWISHKTKHYGVGWIDGRENPIDVQSFRKVLNECIRFFKENKIKQLKCRLCGIAMKSGLGLIGHIENCGLSDEEKLKQRVTCKYCQKCYTRLSFPTHIKNCLEINAKPKTEKIEENLDDNIVFTNSGRCKRKSVIRAEKKKMKEGCSNETKDKSDLCTVPCNAISEIILEQKFQLNIENNGIAKCIDSQCEFKSSCVEELLKHNSSCTLVSRVGFVCVDCNFNNNNQNIVIDHYNHVHKNNEVDSESDNDSNVELNSNSSESSNTTEASSDNDSTSETQNKKRKKNKSKKKSVTKFEKPVSKEEETSHASKWRKLIYVQGHAEERALCWNKTLEFQDINFTESMLFPELPSYKVKTKDSLASYFPNIPTSMKFTIDTETKFNDKFGISKKSINEWQQIERFSSKGIENEKFIFMGGAISALSWIPVPHKKKVHSQYLAVTCKNNIYTFTKCIDPKPMQTIICIYEIESVENFDSSDMKPKLLYGILFDTGPIHQIEFIPSGGYSEEFNRLGLMAVASIENDVEIYSLPIKTSINCDNNDEIFINLKPIMILKLNLKNLFYYTANSTFYNKSQCFKLCWSKAKDHKIIMGCYENGFVSIWNIDNENNINMIKIGSIRCFAPITYFQVAKDPIGGADFHYDINGVRWLVIATIWKDIIVYDIKDLSSPQKLISHSEAIKINNIKWPEIWECPLYCGPVSICDGHGILYSISPLGIHYNSRKVFETCAEIQEIGYNSFLNICATVSNNGDVSMFYSTILNLNLKNRTKICNRMWMSFTNLVRLDNEPIKNEMSDNFNMFDLNYKDKYGLIIGKVSCVKDKNDHTKTSRNLPIWMQTYVKINKIACNNNLSGHRLYAVGYENGLVRINKFKESVH